MSLEKKYSANPDLTKAALQIGLGFQRAIDFPEDPFETQKQISKGLSCVYAILDAQQTDLFLRSQIVNEIRDIVVSTSEQRIKRYIRYNSNLSGNVFPASRSNITSCDFKYIIYPLKRDK